MLNEITEGIDMSDQEDRLNWIKNLIQMMCCDRDIDKSEKEFLFKAARQ